MARLEVYDAHDDALHLKALSDPQRITVLCADLADIIHSKQIANRDKDRGVLPLLRDQIDELHQQQRLQKDGRAQPEPGFDIDL